MEKISRRDFLRLASVGGAAAAATLLSGCELFNSTPVKATKTPMLPSLTGTPTPKSPEIPTGTPTPKPETPTGTPTSKPETPTATVTPENPLDKWNMQWPNTAGEAAAKFGGDASQWQRNPEWPDTRTINSPALDVSGYVNLEWRPANPENLPFNWPKNPKEAVEYFFPGQKLDSRFIQPAWIDPKTKLTTGWHLSEDHWLIDGSKADVTLMLHAAEVAEGYTVNGTLDPSDDRNWVAFGGFKENNVDDLAISLPKGQGITVWTPGTDPNAVALRMELFTPGDTPHYQGLNGKQLGPDAIGFDPVYPAPSK